MNRKNYEMFVRKCRMIILLRRELYEGDIKILSKEEWRWKINKVCENDWNKYEV
jgi:hypothetical protein